MSLASILQLGNSVGVGMRALPASLAMTVACAAFAAPPAARDAATPSRGGARQLAPSTAPQLKPPVKPQAAPPATRPSAPGPRVEPKPREVAPARPVAPMPTKPVDRPPPRKPIEVSPAKPAPSRPDSKPHNIEPRGVEPRGVEPRGVEPRGDEPRKPVNAPSKTPIASPKSPKGVDNGFDDENEVTPRPRPVRDDAPIVRPSNPPVKRPDPVVVRTPRPSDDVRNDAPKPKAPPAMPRELGKPAREHFIADAVHGVPIARHGDRDRDERHDRPVIVDNRTYDRYATNVSRCNGWSFGARWSDCGPCDAWQPYACRDGARVSFGFGSGFSFGFYYGTSCAPLCASWCNPWWEGYACSWSCAPYGWSCSPWYRPACWDPCRPLWHSWYACGPCPVPTWTPCYAYSVYTPVVYTQTVYVPPVVRQPALPNPDALWAFLADGYDRDAEDGFILLESAYPADARWTIGQAIARAFRSDTMRAADLLRQAFANDPTAILRCTGDAKFAARLEALERSLMPAATAARPSTDALLVLAASQASRGELREAYLNATTAEAEGDRSRGTSAFVSWLRAELRRVP